MHLPLHECLGKFPNRYHLPTPACHSAWYKNRLFLLIIWCLFRHLIHQSLVLLWVRWLFSDRGRRLLTYLPRYVLIKFRWIVKWKWNYGCSLHAVLTFIYCLRVLCGKADFVNDATTSLFTAWNSFSESLTFCDKVVFPSCKYSISDISHIRCRKWA